jgi:gamma-glutamyltranspeptidase/glutathione hydrolase
MQMYSQYGVNQTKSTIGGLAVGVPGELRAWESLHARHGSLPFAKLFAPAIDLARNGFIVNRDLAGFINGSSFILNDTNWSESYAPNGQYLKEGDRAYRLKFANTLERIANEGVDVFYNSNSSIAQNIVSKVQETGGIMTADDLEGYKVLVKNASMITYRYVLSPDGTECCRGAGY